MNDFTKDDLEELYFFTSIHKNKFQVKYPQELLDKLQSMIDNYCEHNESCDHDWGVGFGSIHSPVIYCKICHCQKPPIPNEIFMHMMEINK